MNISVVVPVHNEANNIPLLLQEISSALRDLAFEVLVVDDASQDDTVLRVQAAAKQFPQVRVIRHRTQSGQSAAVLTGVRHAKAPWVATLDGDGQNDPADLPALFEKVQTGTPDPAHPLVCVCGHRAKRQDTWLKRFSSRTANRVRAYLLKDHTPDTGCGIKIFNREAFLRLPHFDHCHRFLPALFLREGGKVISVPVNHRPRQHGQSKYGLHNRLWVGLVDIFGVMWLQRRKQRPEIIED